MAAAMALVAALWAANGPAVMVADVRGQPIDIQVLAATAQGLLNADAPRTFLIWNDDCLRWLGWDEKRFGVRPKRVSIRELVRAAARRAKGYVRWDASRLDTALVATTICGAEDLLAGTKSCEDVVRSAGLKLTRDLVGKFDGRSRAEMFRWLFDNYRDRCTRKWLLNSTVPGVEHWDVTKYVVGGGFRLRFEDRTKDDGLGAKLRWVKVIADGRTIAAFRVFTDAEKPYLIDPDHSWPDGDRDRIADRTQYFVYEFHVPAKAHKVVVEAMVRNGYLVKAAPLGSSDYEVLPTTLLTRANWPGFQKTMLDLAVALRMMCVDLSSHPDDKDEYAVRDAIARWLEPPAGWLGWHTERDGEGQYVFTASKYGHFVICSGAANLSFHRHMRPKTMPRPTMATHPRLDPSKVYVSFILSDGDALWCDYNFQAHQWLNERRGQVPFGWEVQPLLIDLGPDILTYYIENASDADCLVGAFVAGYYYPSAMSAEQLRRYLRFAAGIARQTGFRTCTVLNNKVTPHAVAEQFNRYLGGVVDYIEEGYSGMAVNDMILPNLTWMSARLPRWDRLKAEQILADLLERAKGKPADEPQFVPCHFPIGAANYSTALWLAERLPRDRFVILRPDQLFALAREWYTTHPRIAVPDEIVVVDGLAAAASVDVENTTAHQVRVTVSGAGASASARVGAYGVGRLRLLWPKLEGPTVSVLVKVDGKGRREKLVVRHVDVADDLVAGAKAAETERMFNAQEMPHRYGTAGKLPGSWAPVVWIARQAAAKGPEHIVFGPYIRVAPGRYLVVFRIQLLEPLEGAVAMLDVAAGAGHAQAVRRELRGKQMHAGRWDVVALPVKFDKPASQVEFRVQRLNQAPLAVDRIYLVRLE